MMANTKSYIEIQYKGFPVGKKVRCCVMLEGFKDKNEIESFVKDNLHQIKGYEDYTLHCIKVFNNITSNSKRYDDEYNVLVFKNVVDALEPIVENKIEIKKENVPITDFTSLTDEKLVEAKRKINDEILKRRYGLNSEQYKFYLENKDHFDIAYVKEAYEKYNGDIFKYKKDKIRNKVNLLLENKKVV